MELPTKGFIGDGSNMVDPHKVGKVMWARTAYGSMAPLDLHGTLSVNDMDGLNKVFEALRLYRKVGPAIKVLRDHRWDNMIAIKPYLLATMGERAEARELKRTDDWDTLWFAIN
jgi:hypothetical protein